jgi:uncharacterized protein (TIGR02300 family)
VTKPDLGLKRRCMTCGAKFYDLNRSPITCPKCGTPFQAAPLTPAPAPVAARARDEEEPEAEAAGPELVSLEDVGADAAATEDVSIDDINTGDDATDDTFLEEEEEGEDDVSGLIEGDLKDDEA